MMEEVTFDRPVYSLTTKPAVLDSYEDAMEQARKLIPLLQERVSETEKLRHLHSENVADILRSGLYGVMTPKRWGGSELGAQALIDASVELASACPSSGWVYMLWAAHMWLLALFPPETQEELWSNPNVLASSVVNTVGDVQPVEGGYRWTGRGFFSSGVDHCSWLTAAVPIKRGDGKPPQRTWLLIPREDLEIVDDWFTVGLKGTGSKTIIVNDVFIPERRTVSATEIEEGRSPGALLHPNTCYCAISSANFTAAMGAPAIGAARGFLNLFEERLRGKLAAPDQTQADGLTATMARYAQAVAQVDAVQALTRENARRFSSVPASQVSPKDRAHCRRDQAFAAQSCRRAVNTLYEEGGGSSLFDNSDIQRMWRDANAAAAHHGLTWDWIGISWAKTQLDVPMGTTLNIQNGG